MARVPHLLAALAVGLVATACLAQSGSTSFCPCANRYWAMAAVGLDTTLMRDSVPIPLKSPTAGFNYSFWGTIIPVPTIVLTVPGLIFGPSLGYFYAGKPGRAWTGIGLRTAGFGGVVTSFLICGWDCSSQSNSADAAMAVFIAGTGLMVGSAIVDIAGVKSAVRDHNAKLSARRSSEQGSSPGDRSALADVNDCALPNRSLAIKTLSSLGVVYLPQSKTFGLGVRIAL